MWDLKRLPYLLYHLAGWEKKKKNKTKLVVQKYFKEDFFTLLIIRKPPQKKIFQRVLKIQVLRTTEKRERELWKKGGHKESDAISIAKYFGLEKLQLVKVRMRDLLADMIVELRQHFRALIAFQQKRPS